MERPKLENIRFILIGDDIEGKPRVKIVQNNVLHTPGLNEAEREVITKLLVDRRLRDDAYTVDIRRLNSIKEFCQAMKWLKKSTMVSNNK